MIAASSWRVRLAEALLRWLDVEPKVEYQRATPGDRFSDAWTATTSAVLFARAEHERISLRAALRERDDLDRVLAEIAECST